MILRKLGGIGALLISVYFIGLVVTIAVIMPAQGFAGDASAFHTPSIALAYAQESFVFPEYYWLAFVFGVGLLFASLTIYEYFQQHYSLLAKLSLIVGIIGAGLSFSETIVGVKVISELADLYISQPAEAGAAYLSINLLTGALRVGYWQAFGWWVLLSSLVGVQSNFFVRPLWITGIVVGVVAIGAIVSSLVIIHVMLGFIWSLWLGITLFKRESHK